jgi:VWFA-related protein
MAGEMACRRMLGVGFCCVVSCALGQQSDSGVVFRANTKLVEVSVIAEVKQGDDKPAKPITDLRREDFQIFDNGVRQEIRLFVAPTEPTAPPEARPADEFTNRIAGARAPHSGYSAIVFDNLVTDFGDPLDKEGTGFGVQKVLQALATISPSEKIAIYALGRKLRVIGEFTADRELLEQRLRAWKPSADDAKTGTALCIAEPAPGGKPTAGRQESIDSCVRNDSLQRQVPYDAEMELIADHMAGIPGRKNLILMANRFPVSGRALRKLIDADVAVHTVDEAGVNVYGGVPGYISQVTGGLKYARRNDLDVAVREAVEDGRAAYILGFYQPANDANPFGADLPATGPHQIEIRVTQPRVHLRYRTSYQMQMASGHPKAPVQDLIEALNRPVDATGIGITASATRTQDRLHLMESFDISGLDLQLEQGVWKGRAEVVARFLTAEGTWAGDAAAETLTLSLKAATYEAALKNGLRYGKELTIPPKAVELKLLIGNVASGKMGTLTIPLTEVRAAGTDSK